MTIFDVLSLIGGLCLFLFDMNVMGANIGTTVTAWILSLGGISSDSLWVQLLKPTSFTPVLALIGTLLLMFAKSSKATR